MAAPNIQARLDSLLAEVRRCTLCAAALPLGPRPVLRAHSKASILVVGQAPGTRVHESGVPWNDPSGVRLRQWLDVSPETFYDMSKFAIIPMGFCYPGRDARGGDAPPRPECAPHWHARLLGHLPNIQLTLLIGSYAQRHYLGGRAHKRLSDTVSHWRDYGPDYLPAPHPSPRNVLWLKRHPWFESEVVPHLRERVHALLG
ncbi:MAG: uracil-DNA glycosylase family protein [Planctomycetes bacterium]|nr:uracil-DNA glycosylase family protein [Planctomycetota bacterium]